VVASYLELYKEGEVKPVNGVWPIFILSSYVHSFAFLRCKVKSPQSNPKSVFNSVRLVHPASPVLLTKNGPPSSQISYLFKVHHLHTIPNTVARNHLVVWEWDIIFQSSVLHINGEVCNYSQMKALTESSGGYCKTFWNTDELAAFKMSFVVMRSVLHQC